MKSASLRLFLMGASAASVLVAVACSSSDSSAPIPSPVVTNSPTPPEGSADGDAPPSGDAATTASPPTPVSFAYKPSWKGAVKVEVLGAFGLATDWTSPFLTLTDSGDGTFRGTSPPLATGKYPYVFRVTGDEAGPTPAKYVRYAIDPALSTYTPCPTSSPTYAKATPPNPCSELVLPAGEAPALAHVRGHVLLQGAPTAGYLVMIEREESDAHHYFVDRTTSGADGSYDLVVAPGTWRVSVLHPTFYAMTDTQRTDPALFAAVRRTLASPIPISGDVVLNAAEVSFGSYAAMEPRNGAPLPTTFTFAITPGAKAHAAVYGPGKNVGDPWWTGPLGSATTSVFDGGFTTPAAGDAGLEPDAHYAWGTEEVHPKPADGGLVSWTAQSMVFPIEWP
jgi:hypothetical protein